MKGKTSQVPTLALTLILFLICGVDSVFLNSCHYSCKYCGDHTYSHCIICQDGFILSPIKNKQNLKQNYNTLEQQPWGSCIGLIPSFNILGLLLFLTTVALFTWLKNRTIFYFLNSMQTFALFSLIQIGYVPSISYILQSFEYFLFVSSLDKPSKQQSLQIFQDSRYRMYEFLHKYDFKVNFWSIFWISLATFILAFLMPVCRYFSKKEGSLWSICNCVNLQKVFNSIEIASIICFLFLIQESILMISVGIFLDDGFDTPGNIILVSVYSVILTMMIVNLCSKNLDIFPNKGGQQVQILKKCILPTLIVLPVTANIAVAPFMFVTAVLGLVFNSINHKQVKRTQFYEGLVKRQFRYRIVEMAVIVMIIVYFIVQKFAMSQKASNAVGIITIIFLSAFICCFLIQVSLQLYGKYWLKQDQKLYRDFTSSSSSMRQSKTLQQTLQNFQTTQQGIMDMIFFNRTFSSQKQSPTKDNIKLDLDVLNESEDLNQANKISEKLSPNNREAKSRTARTPKNDRSNRFRLNKIFQPQNQNDVQKVAVRQINMQQDATNQQKSGRTSNLDPKTGRRYEPINTVRQIKIQLKNDYPQSRSPRFGQPQTSNGNQSKVNEQMRLNKQNLIQQLEQNQPKLQVKYNKQQDMNKNPVRNNIFNKPVRRSKVSKTYSTKNDLKIESNYDQNQTVVEK